ncbi:MAG: hypothetical protein ACYTFG_07270 [Planctomycetota bacterium]
MEDIRNKILAFLRGREKGEVAITLFIPHQNQKYGKVYAVEFTIDGKDETVSWFCIDGQDKVHEIAATELSDTIEIG